MFEIVHKCKELEFANSINAGDMIIHYDNWGENDFKEWLVRNQEPSDSEYEDQIIDTMGIKFCPYCGKELNEEYAEYLEIYNMIKGRD